MQIKPELQQYLKLKKWRYRPVGNGKDVAVQTCPFCDRSKYKFYVHTQTTQFRCWHCDARGNLYKLKRELGDLAQKGVTSAAKATGAREGEGQTVPMKAVARWHKALLRSNRALEYCEQRGFSEEAIRHFKLGLRKKNRRTWLTIPHIVDDTCYNVKHRTIEGEKRFMRVKGCDSVLFNADALADHNEIVLCEAETDAISFWAAGVRNVVSMTAGAGSFLPEWYDQLVDKERIVLALDADAVGQTGARDIARRLGFDKCENVLLPMHDANEVLTDMGDRVLARTIEGAEPFEVDGLMRANEVLMHCTQQIEVDDEGIVTPWPDVNRLIGKGWQRGDLVVLTAKPKMGKTTLAMNIARGLGRVNIPSLIYCLEMRPTRLATKLVQIERQKAAEDLMPLDYKMTRYKIRKMPIYFIDPSWNRGNMKVEGVFDKIREVVKRHGIRLLVFDHLHFLCRSLQHLTNEIGNVTRGFKLLAEELAITILLIAHPRKTNSNKPVTSEDLKDSQSIHADADQVMVVHRDAIPANLESESAHEESEALEPKTRIIVDAARFQGGGSTLLWYQGETATFYDWEERPVQKLK
jgi:KaiC/GvpD/RAD55 family RecA-like ATPase